MQATMDPEYERHRRTWISFTKWVKWSVGSIVVLLLAMAYFLV